MTHGKHSTNEFKGMKFQRSIWPGFFKWKERKRGSRTPIFRAILLSRVTTQKMRTRCLYTQFVSLGTFSVNASILRRKEQEARKSLKRDWCCFTAFAGHLLCWGNKTLHFFYNLYIKRGIKINKREKRIEWKIVYSAASAAGLNRGKSTTPSRLI